MTKIIWISLLLCSQAVWAHTLWLMPSHFVLSGEDSWISVDLSAANMTFVPDKGIGVANLSIVLPDGSRQAFAQSYQGRRKSQADHQLINEGTYLLVNGGAPRFLTSYQLEGERKRLAADKREAARTLPAAATDVSTSRIQSTALAVVNVKAPTRTALTPANQGFELNFITHPADYVSGEPIRWQLLQDGKAVVGATIELSREGELYRNNAGRVQLISDAAGEFSFTPADAGRYLLEARHQSEQLTELYDQLRATLTLTFEAGLP